MKKVFLIIVLFILVQGFNCSSNNVSIAKYFIEKEDWGNAEKYLLKEIELNIYADEAYYLLGYVNAETKKYSEMEKNFIESLKISDRFSGKIDEARNYYKNIKNK